MTNKPKTIAEFRTALAAAKAKPGIERTALADYAALLEARPAPPITDGVAAYLADRMARAEIKRALAEFDEWRLDARTLAAEQAFLQNNAPEIFTVLREDIETRAAKLPTLLGALAKRLSVLAEDAFGSDESREKNRIAREQVEAEAEALEAQVSDANSAARMFEISPTVQGFEAAAAIVEAL